MSTNKGKQFIKYSLVLDGVSPESLEDKSKTEKIQSDIEKGIGLGKPEYGMDAIGPSDDGKEVVQGVIVANTKAECNAILKNLKAELKSVLKPFGCTGVSLGVIMGGKYTR